jgi:broad specificity phosphatase PhoE
MRPDHVLHSGLLRTRAVAEPLADRLGLFPLHAPAWRERDFGDWEGRTWNAIYRASGDAMDGMIDAPDSFRPGGNGETTGELITRIGGAFHDMPRRGRIVIICHGGPIAVVSHLQERTRITALATHIIPPGSLVELDIEFD